MKKKTIVLGLALGFALLVGTATEGVKKSMEVPPKPYNTQVVMEVPPIIYGTGTTIKA